MTELIQISTTAGTRADVERMAMELVTRGLAACVQVTGPVASTYRWQGQVEVAEEWMCVIKTGREKLAAIQQLFQSIHPYEVPELIATPIVDGGESYLKWLREQLIDGIAE